jgi:hypothetical protein
VSESEFATQIMYAYRTGLVVIRKQTTVNPIQRIQSRMRCEKGLCVQTVQSFLRALWFKDQGMILCTYVLKVRFYAVNCGHKYFMAPEAVTNNLKGI